MNDAVTELVPATKKAEFGRYFQCYLREHSAFTGGEPQDGVFPYPWFDLYWQEPGRRWPFWMRRAKDIVAFVLVRIDDADGRYEMAEFFVVNRYRGQGIGNRFAKDLILRFNGLWKVNQVRCNVRAVAFWRRVLDEITDYEEASLMRDVGIERIEQRFVI